MLQWSGRLGVSKARKFASAVACKREACKQRAGLSHQLNVDCMMCALRELTRAASALWFRDYFDYYSRWRQRTLREKVVQHRILPAHHRVQPVSLCPSCSTSTAANLNDGLYVQAS